jgi:hypothetical protein
LNEAEHPTGPDLGTWTVDNLRVGWSDAIAAEYPSFWADIERLKRGDRNAMESAVRFLEADPWWPRSGYEKAVIIRQFLKMDLSGYETRLRDVVDRVVDDTRPRRELREYARLARSLWNEQLAISIEARAKAGNPKARWLLRAVASLVPKTQG